MRRLEINRRRHTALQRLLIPRGTKAPFVAWLQAREIPLRVGRDQVVALENRVIEEFARHFYANRVHTDVFRTGPAISIPVKTSERLSAAATEFGSKNVRQHEG